MYQRYHIITPLTFREIHPTRYVKCLFTNIQISSRFIRLNAKFSRQDFYMDPNMLRDFQICISVPLSLKQITVESIDSTWIWPNIFSQTFDNCGNLNQNVTKSHRCVYWPLFCNKWFLKVSQYFGNIFTRKIPNHIYWDNMNTLRET